MTSVNCSISGVLKNASEMKFEEVEAISINFKYLAEKIILNILSVAFLAHA